MIRFRDASVLAYTKLRSHRIRTGITVGIAGILFGLILAVIFVVQGVFDSVERFGKEGLNDRAILAVTYYDQSQFNLYDHMSDASFIAEVEAVHAQTIAKKTAAAKKYGVPYDAASEDPTPIVVDAATKKKTISDTSLDSAYVQEAANARSRKTSKPFDIAAYLKPYKTVTILQDNFMAVPDDGSFLMMKDGKERELNDRSPQEMYGSSSDDPIVSVYDGSITKPFISNTTFDPVKGELPVILPYSQAEKLLGLKKLDKTASNDDRLSRLYEVRERVGEISASYCYRNQASSQLLSLATAQQEEIAKNKTTPGYIEPSITYTLPDQASCGGVVVAKDTRTPAEKQLAAQQILYEKAVGIYLGEPKQQKVTFRAVGISSDTADESSMSSIGSMVSSLLGSNLGYNAWSIPADLLRQVPENYRPNEVFGKLGTTNANENSRDVFGYDAYLIEFGDKSEARAVLEQTGAFRSMGNSGNLSAYPFGSGVLIVDEAKKMFSQFIFWAMIVVGGVAAVILGGIIGRTVSEGRRESAVFRAIGAKRSDIAGIYGVYVLLLSLRVTLFAVVLGGVIGLVVELVYWRDATTGARITYAASDTTANFHLFGIGSWYVLVVIGTIVAVSLLGSVVPIIRNVRRNPINDMRDE